MTPSEFKAWFTGYSEGIDVKPSEKQWKRICERVAEIDGVVTSYPVFIDRYWHWPPQPVYTPYYYRNTWNTVGGLASNPAQPVWQSSNAFVMLGQADAKTDV